MKTTKLFLLLFNLFLCSSLFAQTVILDVLTVNGQSAAATAPINFGTNTTITVGLFTQISLPNAPSDNNPGTIKIIYQRNTGTSQIIASGGNGGNLLFYGDEVSGRNFTVTLSSSQFDNTGGILYSEYQTFSGVKYKSANKSVIKSTVTNPPIGPTNPSNNNNVTEFVPYEGIPLLPELTPNSVSSDGTINEYNWVYDDGIFDKVFTINGGSSRGSGMLRNSVKLIPRIKITRPNGVIEYYVYPRGAYPNGSTFYAFVINSGMQVQNYLSEDQYVPLGENSQTITGNVPNIIAGNGVITGYLWQKRQAFRNPNFQEHLASNSPFKWEDIPNSNILNYTAPYSTQLMEYRRLTIFNYYNSRSSSNVVKVCPVIPPSTKEICCNQIVPYQGVINPITGYPSITDNNYRYQWQKGVDNNGIRYWNNILNANSVDYTPINLNYTNGNRTYHDIYYYRRIVVRNSDGLHFLSNVVTRQFLARNTRFNNQSTNNNIEGISIFPNPSSSIIHIKSDTNLSSYKIKIIDLTGRIMISKEQVKEEANLLLFDISYLPSGIYNLVLENSDDIISKKIIKN